MVEKRWSQRCGVQRWDGCVGDGEAGWLDPAKSPNRSFHAPARMLAAEG